MASVTGHVIVCGLSALGVRVAEQLVASGVAVVVVDDQGSPSHRRRLERRGVRVVPESSHSAEALRDADIDTALAVAACHDVDLENLQTALAAADVAPATQLVVNIGNAQLGDQLAAAIPTAHVINTAARVGPSFVEACVRSNVVHAFTMRPGQVALGSGADIAPAGAATEGARRPGRSDAAEVFVVAEATVDEADAFRARYGDLTPISLRRRGERAAVLCPPRDIPLVPGDRLTVLGRLAEFDARGMAGAGLEEARTFAALAAVAAVGDSAGDDTGPAGTNEGHRQDGGGRRAVDRARALAATVRSEFDRPFRWALGAVLAIMVISTTVLSLTYPEHNAAAPPDFDTLDALYLTVETMATVGYGDYNFGSADHWLQVFGIFLMLLGALSIAVIYAFLTNIIISRRLERALGRGRAGTVRGHVVLCGLGKVGTATMEGLLRAGRRVVVIERNENNRFLSVARERGVPVVVGDATVRATLQQAGIGYATTIAALTSDGVANLETVLSARDAYEELVTARHDRARRVAGTGGRAYGRRFRRTAEPDDESGLRVVLRIADSTMTDEVERRFDIHTVRSAAALASPYFVGATLGYDVISTFYVERTPFLVARLVVRADAALAGPTLAELAIGARVLAVTSSRVSAAAGLSFGPAGPSIVEESPDGTAAGPERPNFRPGRYTRLRPGDELLVVGPVTDVVDMIRLNQRPADTAAWEADVVDAETDPLDD